MVELKKQATLPTTKEVILGYNWRFNELKIGKGLSYHPKGYDVEKLVLEDIKKLGNTLVYNPFWLVMIDHML